MPAQTVFGKNVTMAIELLLHPRHLKCWNKLRVILSFSGGKSENDGNAILIGINFDLASIVVSPPVHSRFKIKIEQVRLSHKCAVVCFIQNVGKAEDGREQTQTHRRLLRLWHKLVVAW